MLNLHLLVHALHQRQRAGDDGRQLLGADVVNAELILVHDAEEAAAEGDIHLHIADLRHLDHDVLLIEERRDVAEADLDGAAVLDLHMDVDGARGRLERDVGVGLGHGDHAQLHKRRGDADRAVAAHVQTPFAVDKQHPVVTGGIRRLGDDRAEHIGVAARLKHHSPAQVVIVLHEVVLLLHHGLALEHRQAADDDTGGLTHRVGIHGADGMDDIHACFSFRGVNAQPSGSGCGAGMGADTASAFFAAERTRRTLTTMKIAMMIPDMPRIE